MTVREILKMGDARLLRVARPVEAFGTPALRELIKDMFETMYAANGAGLAAPQIGIDLQLVIFGFGKNQRYPDAPPVPETVLINPTLTPLDDTEEEGWEGCLSVPGLRGVVPRHARIRYTGFDADGTPIERVARASMPASCSTSATTWSARSTRCACAISRASATPACSFRNSTPATTTEVRPGLQVQT